jgi:hypothetical protein
LVFLWQTAGPREKVNSRKTIPFLTSRKDVHFALIRDLAEHPYPLIFMIIPPKHAKNFDMVAVKEFFLFEP